MSAEMTYADVVAGVGGAIAAYAHALDDGRTDDVVALFTPDGVSDIPGTGVIEGHDALLAAYGRWKPRRPQRHIVANTCVTTWNDTEATAVSDLMFLLKGDAGWAVQMVGRYHDTLRRVDGTWLFSRRVASFE